MQSIEDDISKNYQHPQSFIGSDSESQVTLQNFNNSQPLSNEKITQSLKNFSIEERKYLIIDRSSGKIFDTRDQQSIDDMLDKNYNYKSCNSFSKKSKPSDTTEKLSNSDLQKNNQQDQIQKQRKEMLKELEKDCNIEQSSEFSLYNPSTTQNVWDEYWQQLQQIHQKMLAAICQKDTKTFDSILNKKENQFPININYKSFDNWTPLHYASMHAQPNIFAKILKAQNLNINAKTTFGCSALHIAVNSNKKDVCDKLLKAGIDANALDSQGNTALHYATELGYKELVQLLLNSKKIDSKIKNNKGLKASDLCLAQQILKLFPQQEKQHKTGYLAGLMRNKKVQYIQNIIFKKNPSAKEQTVNQLSKQSKESSNNGSVQSKKKGKLTSRQDNIFKMYTLLKKTSAQCIGLGNFKFYRKIGEGAFGEVYVVKKNSSQKLYALKAIKKEKVMKTNLYRYIQTQKEILSLIQHPFIVKLHYAFQTDTYLFLVMDYCEGGDLGKLLQKKKKFDEPTSKAYAAEVLLAIQALHKNKIIYRDMKPQNIVLDQDGHALLTDFGLSKKTTDLDALNKSFCGTPAYLPLEIIDKKGHTRMADWYQYGIVLYELMVGIPPFYAETRLQLYNNVRKGIIKFPRNVSENFKDLIKKLLTQNYQKRLGYENDAQSVKEHKWFQDIDWQDVYNRKLQMPKIEKKIQLPREPMRCKFQDIKTQKFKVDTWSFISPS